MSGPEPRSRPLPSQAPILGRAKRWLGAFHFTGVFWFRIHCWGTRVIPDWAIAPIITLFTGIFFFVLKRVGRDIASNLEPVLGPCGWWRRQQRKLRTFWAFAWCLTERYERLATDKPIEASHDNEEIWHDLVAKGQGMLLVTAHIGHWEAGAMGTPTGFRHVNVVREEEMDPRSQDFTRELFEQRLGEGVSMHFAGDPLLGMKMLAALRRGELVAVQGDRPRTGGRTHRSRIFGRPIDLPLGPAALARAAGVPMLPVFIFRDGRLRSRTVFRPPVHVDSDADREGLGRAMDEIAGYVEDAIREAPHQWFCFRALWPDGEKIEPRATPPQG